MRVIPTNQHGYTKSLIWLLVLVLVITQTVVIAHYHPENTSDSDIAISSFTPELTKFVQAHLNGTQKKPSPDSPADQDESCVLCLLFQLSWDTVLALVSLNPLQPSDDLIIPQHHFFGTVSYQYSLARAPPQFS